MSQPQPQADLFWHQASALLHSPSLFNPINLIWLIITDRWGDPHRRKMVGRKTVRRRTIRRKIDRLKINFHLFLLYTKLEIFKKLILKKQNLLGLGQFFFKIIGTQWFRPRLSANRLSAKRGEPSVGNNFWNFMCDNEVVNIGKIWENIRLNSETFHFHQFTDFLMIIWHALINN